MGSIAEIYIIYTLCHDFDMNLFGFLKRRIYMDYAAATPIRKEVEIFMRPYLKAKFANPSAIYKEGQEARKAIDDARAKVAVTLGVKPTDVTFTGSGTESNNLAIVGYLKHLAREKDISYRDMEVVMTKLEHPSVSGLAPIIEATGVTVKYVAVNELGLITKEALREVLSEKTVLVTFAYANSEIGVVQRVSHLVREIREVEKKNGKKITVHIDAAQAPLWLPCEVVRLGADLLTLDAGKCFGPKGVGVLIKRGVEILPLMYGGGQEEGLRPGTENVSGIVGAAEAIRLAQIDQEERSIRVAALRDKGIAVLKEILPTAVLNGPTGEDRLANNINISIPGFDTEYAVVYLDAHGVAASTKSACSGSKSGRSVVVETISGDTKRASSTLRLTLGPDTKLSEIEYTAKVLERFCSKMSSLTK